MEKDIDRIPKNQETDIVIRIDDFGGRIGLTIREFVKSERYTGFTKAGTRIPADQFKNFKASINSIKESDFEQEASEEQKEAEEPESRPAHDKHVSKQGSKQDNKSGNKPSHNQGHSHSDAPEEMEM
ncbi:hypothetical protein AUJ84_04100 [Candidatus Pacearchaeota archaeon CG1_02_32_132]|nr:MAG: hypothetical protein AUJ84_04100 [Candidatus Pacearchaeota archaeon CG1_02_32_132]